MASEIYTNNQRRSQNFLRGGGVGKNFSSRKPLEILNNFSVLDIFSTEGG